MKIISVINQKGGVGKSTTVDAICSGLTLKGCKVLSLDMDPQCNYSFANGLSDHEDNNTLEILLGKKNIADCVRKTDRGDVVPGHMNLTSIDMFLEEKGKDRFTVLKKAISKVVKKYDFIVIDTPPGLGTLTLNSLSASDTCIIPAQAEIFSIQGVSQLNSSINTVKDNFNPDLHVVGILLTKFSGRTVISKDLSESLKALAAQMGTKVFDAKIRECNALREAQAVHKGIYDYAPRSNAVTDYSNFLLELFIGSNSAN